MHRLAALAVIAALFASVACVGGRAGYRVSYLGNRDTGPFVGLYTHVLLPNDSDRTTALGGVEVAALGSPRGEQEYNLSAVAAPHSVHEVEGGLLFPTLHLGLQFGEGFSMAAAACYGAYGLHVQAFACARWSTIGWLGADFNLGTNSVEALIYALENRTSGN